MPTERQRLIRNAKRCLADLFGGHVWMWLVSQVRDTSAYVLTLRRGELASDEIKTLEGICGEIIK